ncbi:MAG: DUF401 family protein [Candidatus Ozemobacteraceae bacterium]
MTETTCLSVFSIWMTATGLFLWRGFPLGNVILAVSVGLSLSLGNGISGLARDSIFVSLDPQVFELLGIVILIFFFSNLLKTTKRIDRVTAFLKTSLKDPRWILVAVPALVGLIPMPGGAMFTAPITEEMGNEIDLSPEDKVFSNYWFRHCWELAFPLYPGIILASGISHISPMNLAQTLLPLALTAFFSGVLLVFFRWKSPSENCNHIAQRQDLSKFKSPSIQPEEHGLSKLDPACDRCPEQAEISLTWQNTKQAENVFCLWPLVSVIGMAMLKVPLIPGLIAISLLLAVVEKVEFPNILQCLRQSFQFPVILIVWAVFLFGRTLQTTGLLDVLSRTFISAGMPVWLITLILPFFLGALTGVTTGFVGPLFPLLMPLWGKNPEIWIQLAYAGGLAGVYLTPSHLCLSLTQEYFRANLGKVLLLICFPVAAILAVALLRLYLA